jgi:hypothetical protein
MSGTLGIAAGQTIGAPSTAFDAGKNRQKVPGQTSSFAQFLPDAAVANSGGAAAGISPSDNTAAINQPVGIIGGNTLSALIGQSSSNPQLQIGTAVVPASTGDNTTLDGPPVSGSGQPPTTSGGTGSGISQPLGLVPGGPSNTNPPAGGSPQPPTLSGGTGSGISQSDGTAAINQPVGIVGGNTLSALIGQIPSNPQVQIGTAVVPASTGDNAALDGPPSSGSGQPPTTSGSPGGGISQPLGLVTTGPTISDPPAGGSGNTGSGISQPLGLVNPYTFQFSSTSVGADLLKILDKLS